VINLEAPDDITSITYLDEVENGIFSAYRSQVVFSEFFIRDGKGKGNSRGRLQLRTLKYTIENDSHYQTTLYNKEQNLLLTRPATKSRWDDSLNWDDTWVWNETSQYIGRTYYNTDKVTISSDSKKVLIIFENNEEDATKGFELHNANVEGLFYQRSQRI
jgi:hypothetical protein